MDDVFLMCDVCWSRWYTQFQFLGENVFLRFLEDEDDDTVATNPSSSLPCPDFSCSRVHVTVSSINQSRYFVPMACTLRFNKLSQYLPQCHRSPIILINHVLFHLFSQ